MRDECSKTSVMRKPDAGNLHVRFEEGEGTRRSLALPLIPCVPLYSTYNLFSMHPLDKGVDKVLIALCTFPDADTARKIVREIVDLRLAACGNILPQMYSIYHWQGKVETADEILAIFKLDTARYPEFEEKLRSLHPYDVPEIISC